MVLDGKCVGDIKAAINRDDIKKQYLNSIMAEIKYRRYSSITSKLLTDIPPELSLEEINLYLEKHKTNMPDTSIPLEELKYYELLLALDRGEDYFTIMALYKKIRQNYTLPDTVYSSSIKRLLKVMISRADPEKFNIPRLKNKLRDLTKSRGIISNTEAREMRSLYYNGYSIEEIARIHRITSLSVVESIIFTK